MCLSESECGDPWRLRLRPPPLRLRLPALPALPVRPPEVEVAIGVTEDSAGTGQAVENDGDEDKHWKNET